MNISQFYDKIIVINLDRRFDRWAQCMRQCDKFKLEVERYPGDDRPGDEHAGCVAAHKAVMELIVGRGHQKTLVLEDDFQILHEDFHERFFQMIHQVPDNWDLLYLGAHYAEPPMWRVSHHVIRSAYLKTTSSYSVTLQQAARMAPTFVGKGPIDELLHPWNIASNCYIFQPRLMVQRASFSNLSQCWSDNSACMTDTRHEEMV